MTYDDTPPVYVFKHPLKKQDLDGNDITEVTLQLVTVGVLRKTANISTPEMRELAIIEKLTGLTPGQLDKVSVTDLEGLQELLRPTLPNALRTGLLVSGFSLASLVGDLPTSTNSPLTS